MKPILEFMQNNPWLTFFIALIIGGTIEESVKAICRRNKK